MGRGTDGARGLLGGAWRFLSSPPGALLLFAATFLTTTGAGANLAGTDPFLGWEGFAAGLPFSLPLLFILGVHESGHWIAARRHGVPSTPPLFLPAPYVPGGFSPGTFGALIRMGSRVPDRNALLDIGAAGPLAGAAAALPVLVLGLSFSRVLPAEGLAGVRLGEPLLFRALSFLVVGPIPEGYELALHPVAAAGWIGLFVTMLNLLPAGQLDGGHVAYALFGPAWGRASRAVPFLLAPLGLLWPGWFVWGLLLLFLGGAHPPTEDDGRPLTRGRRLTGGAAALLLLLCFIPAPVTL